MTDYLMQQDPEDIRNVVRDILVRLAALEQGIISVNRLSELAGEAGDLLGARIISPTDPNITEPTASDFSGWFLSAIMQALADGNFGLANVLNGLVRFGIGESGMLITGVEFLENHTATIGEIARRARRGFQEIDSSPAYLLEYIDDAGGVNLITSNPGFEDGDFTGYSASTNWAVDTDAYAGTYKATSGTDNAVLTTNKYATTAGASYRFTLYSRRRGTNKLTKVLAYAKWYNAVPTLIKTDSVKTSASLPDWAQDTVVLVAPAGSTQVEFYFLANIGTAGDYADVDSLSIELISDYSAIRLDDDGVHALDASKSVNLLGFPQSAFQFATQYITSVTVVETVANCQWNFYRGPAAANANDGDEYLFQFVLDAGTYTMHTYGAGTSQSGQVDYYLDGSGTAFSTGQDWRLGSIGYQDLTVASVVIPTGGRHTVLVKVNGKNALATDYRWLNTAIWFVPATYTAKV